MRKFICCIMSLLLITGIATSALAYEDADISGVSAEPALTPEEIAVNEEFNQWVEKEAQIELHSDNAVNSANASLVQQKTSIYCGPASTKMVYEGITGDYSKTQDWFAAPERLNTNALKGSSSATIAKVLKTYTGKNYSRVPVNGMSLNTMYNNIWYSLSKNCAVVASVSDIPGRVAIIQTVIL